MRKLGLLLVGLLTACAPVATLTPARPAKGFGGTLAISVPYNRHTGFSVTLPYLSLYWGDGEKEFGLVEQFGVSVYAKFRMREDFSILASVGYPGPWVEGRLLYDTGPLTLAGWMAYAQIEWGERSRYHWLGGGSVTYWYRGLGLEAGVVAGEADWVPVFSVGYRLELGGNE